MQSLVNLSELFQEINHLGFQNSLPYLPIRYCGRIKVGLGEFRYAEYFLPTRTPDYPCYTYEILVSKSIGHDYQSCKSVLAHEMVHFWETYLTGDTDHSYAFLAKAQKVSQAIDSRIFVQFPGPNIIFMECPCQGYKYVGPKPRKNSKPIICDECWNPIQPKTLTKQIRDKHKALALWDTQQAELQVGLIPLEPLIDQPFL